MTPLLTLKTVQLLRAAARDGLKRVECSLDLQRSMTSVEPGVSSWVWNERQYPYPEICKDRTIYFWADGSFEPASRFSGSLIKLVPTDWGPPTFEIDGIKMLPTAHVSPMRTPSARST